MAYLRAPNFDLGQIRRHTRNVPSAHGIFIVQVNIDIDRKDGHVSHVAVVQLRHGCRFHGASALVRVQLVHSQGTIVIHIASIGTTIRAMGTKLLQYTDSYASTHTRSYTPQALMHYTITFLLTASFRQHLMAFPMSFFHCTACVVVDASRKRLL